MTCLEVRGLGVRYGAAEVLASVDIEIEEREIVGLVGRNGAGKTTTLRAISGLVPRACGELRFQGSRLTSDPARVARSGIAHVPEGRGIFKRLSVRENLGFAALAIGERVTNADYEDVLKSFPMLVDLLDRPAGLISGGEQQMLAVARGVMTKPRLLMVDELSLGLSPKATNEVLRTLVSVGDERGITLLLVDQNVARLAQVCRRLYVLSDGTAKRVDAPAELSERELATFMF